VKLYHGEQSREEQLASGRISDRSKTDKFGVPIGPCASEPGRSSWAEAVDSAKWSPA
jgi:hypothetical protein